MTASPLKSKPLDPDRYPQGGLFVCDILGATPKGDMASMEHPVYSLTTKLEKNTKRYENGDQYVEIRPSETGLATIHDRDIIIFCTSQMVAALNDGREISQTVRISAAELLRATNRSGGGTGYRKLLDALRRLQGTQVETNVMQGGKMITSVFSLIDSAEIVRMNDTGRMTEVEIKLSDWTYNGVMAKEVLTYSRDYFRLRKPLERRLYELARKHCGMQAIWKIGLKKLQEKAGSSSEIRAFRKQIRDISKADAEHQYLPDYGIEIDKRDIVTFTRRREDYVEGVVIGNLEPETYHDARQLAPGWDVYLIEREWRLWCAKEEIEPKRPDRHFMKFCESWFEKRGRP